jgi:hypothetical protein
MIGAAPLTAAGYRAEIALRRLRAAIQDCARCEALVRCRSRVVPGDGSVPAEVVFVGIAPGRLGGDRTGIPFSGDRSGRLLRRMIEGSGLERVFITNLVRCNPRDAAGKTNGGRRITTTAPAKGKDDCLRFNALITRQGEEIGIRTPANRALTDIVKRVEWGELEADPCHLMEVRLD